MKKALIIGCGIGGPVAALFLKRAGIDAAIYDSQTSAADQGGYFLNVSSNGLNVLKTLGLEAQIAALGFAAPRMVMWSGNGKRLGEVRNGAVPGQGAISVIVKRNALQRSLREAAVCQDVPIWWGKQLVHAETSSSQGVVAHFADGTTAHGDVLIGCDGIHSRAREIIDPNAPKPLYTGLISGGGYAHTTTLCPTLNTQHFVFGKRAFFGYLVKPSGEIYWFCNMAYPGEPRRSELEAIPHSESQRTLLELFCDDQPFIQDIIRATEGNISMYPIYDMPPISRWHSGPLVLMGDAAHATSPSAGQGASMALEDAIVLAKCLRDIPHMEEACATYQRLRKERAEKVVRFSRQSGSNKVASNALTRWLRDATLPFFLKLLANSSSLDWLYSYDVDWQAPVVARPIDERSK